MKLVQLDERRYGSGVPVLTVYIMSTSMVESVLSSSISLSSLCILRFEYYSASIPFKTCAALPQDENECASDEDVS